MGFKIQDGVLEKYEGTDKQVVIPEGVTSIGGFAFWGCSSLTNITIPKGVTGIGWDAFSGCSSLTSITIPESVTSVGLSAFSGCSSLTSITIPEGVTSIGSSAFSGCSSLTSITIPKSVTGIGWDAFSGCSSLTSITIPEGVTSIGSSAFSGCSNLTSITIPKGVTSIEYSAFEGCSSLTSIMVLEGATIIGESAFKGCSGLTSITIPKGVTSIECSTFEGCSSLTSITIPETVTSIGAYAFVYCSSLTNITIPKGVTGIKVSTFSGCSSLTSITIPEGVTSIGLSAFSGCSSLTSITIPKGVTSIETEAFLNCTKLQEITLPSTVKEVGPRAFSGCSQLHKVVVKGRLMASSPTAFRKCPVLREVYILKDFITEDKMSYAKKVFGAKAKLLTMDGAPVIAKEYTMTVAKSARDQEILDQIVKVVKAKQLFPWVEEMALSADDVKYANSEEVAPREAVLSILYAYMRQLPKLPDYRRKAHEKAILPFELVPEADAVAGMLDLESLRRALTGLKLVGSNAMDTYDWAIILPYCRYASEGGIREVITMAGNLLEQGDSLSAIVYCSAVLLNDTTAALDFVKESGNLELYAKIRGTTPDALYRSSLLTNTGLNSSGGMSFDLGPEHFTPEGIPKEGLDEAGKAMTSSRGNKAERQSLPRIEARLTNELKLVLYDVDAGKEVHSFPKKGSDPAKCEAAEAKYKEAKKNIEDAIKRQLMWLLSRYNDGAAEPKEDWTQLFLGDPLLMRIAQLLVWEQEAGKSAMYFTVWRRQTVREDGELCTLSEGKVRLAHPVEMNEGQVSAWQRYFLDRGLKQPFAQVLWEPGIPWQSRDFAEFYRDAVLTKAQWSKLKTALRQRGIDVYSDNMEHESDCYSKTFHFDGTNQMHLGSSLDIEYSINEYRGSVTLGRATIHPEASRREINSVLLELDQATIVSQIERDHASALTDGVLGAFTAAQIASFLEASIEHNATDCTARLLDYKNRRFPEYSEVKEFTLD